MGLVAVSLRFWPVDERRCWLLVALTLAVMGKFYARELLLGQANAMFAVACAGTALAFIRGRERLAGALLAVGVVLKPYGLLLVPWLLARRRRPSSIALGVGLLSAACVPLLEYSVAETMMLHAQWWSTVRDTTAPNLLSADNVSWLAMYTKWLGAGPWPLALWALTGVVAFTMMVWMWAQRTRVAGPEALELAALLLLIPLVSPQGWDYVLLLATPAVVCLLTFARHLPAALRVATFIALAIVGLTFYDVLGRNAYNALMMASGITLSTFVLLSALFVLRLRHAA